MSASDAIGWGAAIVAVGVGIILVTSSIIAVASHLRSRQRIRLIESLLFAEPGVVPVRRAEVEGLSLLGSGLELGMQLNPSAIETFDLHRYEQLRTVRHELGKLQTWELRQLGWHDMALDLVAAFDSGAGLAKSYIKVGPSPFVEPLMEPPPAR